MDYIRYINYNGKIFLAEDNVISVRNRSFRYGDGLFESLCWRNGEIPFVDYHVERLQKGMKLLKLDNVQQFNSEFINQKARELIDKSGLTGAVRLRLNVFRDGAGLYAPESHRAAYLLEADALDEKVNALSAAGLIIDVFREHKKPINALSALKSNNAQLFVLAGIYRKSMALDEVILLNEKGMICEASSSNVFVWYKNNLYTPALSEGCVEGVMRRIVMEVAKANGIEVVEAEMNPEILNEAEELFLTNAVHGLQWVLGYKHKRFFNRRSKDLRAKIEQWVGDQNPTEEE